MRRCAPFGPDDLEELNARLLSRASCVALREVYAGNRLNMALQMRHDVDDNPGAFDCALAMAEWEAARGYRSTYYLLHTASYWGREGFAQDVRSVALLGHEVGIHADALAWCVEHGGDPHEVLLEALRELRSWGVPVRSVAGHGNALCRTHDFANDEQFTECARTQYGPPDRVIRGTELRLEPHALADYGLDFEAVRLGRAFQISDSGGVWYPDPLEAAFSRFPDLRGQCHLLQHPDWWTEAF